ADTAAGEEDVRPMRGGGIVADLSFLSAPVLGLPAFVLVWLAAGALFRRLSGMTQAVPADAGPAVRRSGWGDGTVNGAGFENALRGVEFAGGWAGEGRRPVGRGRA